MDVGEYRRRARHLLPLARQMTDLGNRATMLGLASIWMRLAEQAELNERCSAQREGHAPAAAAVISSRNGR